MGIKRQWRGQIYVNITHFFCIAYEIKDYSIAKRMGLFFFVKHHAMVVNGKISAKKPNAG